MPRKRERERWPGTREWQPAETTQPGTKKRGRERARASSIDFTSQINLANVEQQAKTKITKRNATQPTQGQCDETRRKQWNFSTNNKKRVRERASEREKQTSSAVVISNNTTRRDHNGEMVANDCRRERDWWSRLDRERKRFWQTHRKRKRQRVEVVSVRAFVTAAVLLIEDECFMCLTAYLKEFSMFYGGFGFMSDLARSCCNKGEIVKMDGCLLLSG